MLLLDLEEDADEVESNLNNGGDPAEEIDLFRAN